MKQMSLGEGGFERKTKWTRKREFLDSSEVQALMSETESVAKSIRRFKQRRQQEGGCAANAVLHFVELNTRKRPIRPTQRAGNRQVLRRKLGPVCSVKDG